MSIELKDEILASCNALGFMEGNKYMKEPDCLETLREIIKYLKKDNEYQDARFYLGNQSIVQHDLIPLIIFYHMDKQLFDIIIKLLANLTHPIILLYHNKKPQDILGQKRYIELINILSSYKKAFINLEFFHIIKEKLASLLQLEWDQTFEEEHYSIEYILILIRNILFDDSILSSTSNDTSYVLEVFEKSGIDQLFLYLATSEDHHAFNMHILEIIYFIYIGYDPDDIAKLEKSTKINEELNKLRNIEHMQQNNLNVKKKDRFKGTYCFQGVKSISENDMITHTIAKDIKSVLNQCSRKPIKKGKNRSSVGQKIIKPITSPKVHRFLHNFALKFVKLCYNSFMKNVKDKLVRNNSLESDETHYLCTIAFFLEFSRHLDIDVKYYSETLNNDMMHYLMSTLNKFMESVSMDRDNGVRWGKRAHLALMAYKQMLLALNRLSYSECEDVKNGVKVIKANLFYLPEYRDVLIQMFKSYNPVYYSIDFLKDLIESTHVFVKMLKSYCEEYKHMPVMKRKKKRKVRRRGNKKQTEIVLDDGGVNSGTCEPWQESYEVSIEETVRDGQFDLENSTIKVFDCTLDYDMEEQKLYSLYQIQSELRKMSWHNAIETLKLCRVMWPEDALFGNNDMSIGEEIAALKEIYSADIPKPVFLNQSNGMDAKNDPFEDDDGGGSEEYEDSEDEDRYIEEEDQFDFKRFIYAFVNSTIARCYSQAMKEFQTNSTFTNHCIAKMCYRVAFELKAPGMFYQVSYFKIFQDIFNACAINKANEYKDLKEFATYITQKFVKTVKKNKIAFVDALFWKSAKEALEVESGYEKDDSVLTKSAKGWSEEQEFELETLYTRYMNEHGGLGENFSKTECAGDVVDYLLNNLIDEGRTRRQIMIQCRRQGLAIPKGTRKRSNNNIGERQLGNFSRSESSDTDNEGSKGLVVKARVWTDEDEAKVIALHVMHQGGGIKEMINLMEEELDFHYTREEITDKLQSLELISLKELDTLNENKRTLRFIPSADLRQSVKTLPDFGNNQTNGLKPSPDPYDEILELSDHESETSLHIDLSMLNESQSSNAERKSGALNANSFPPKSIPNPDVYSNIDGISDDGGTNLSDSPFRSNKANKLYNVIGSSEEDD